MISPRAVGDTRPFFNEFVTDTGNFDLSGRSAGDLSMHFLDASHNLTIGTGIWSDLAQDSETGIWTATYTPSQADVSRAGIFRMYPVVQKPGQDPEPFDPQILILENLP